MIPSTDTCYLDIMINRDATLNFSAKRVTIFWVDVMGLAWLGPRPLLLVGMGMGEPRIDGGGDDGMDIILMGGVMRGAGAKGVDLYHKNGDGNVDNGERVGDDGGVETIVGGGWDEMEVTVEGGMVIMELGEKIKIEEGEEEIECIPEGARLLFFFLGDWRTFGAFLFVVYTFPWFFTIFWEVFKVASLASPRCALHG